MDSTVDDQLVRRGCIRGEVGRGGETREEKKGREREGRERGENHEIEKIQPGKHK